MYRNFLQRFRFDSICHWLLFVLQISYNHFDFIDICSFEHKSMGFDDWWFEIISYNFKRLYTNVIESFIDFLRRLVYDLYLLLFCVSTHFFYNAPYYSCICFIWYNFSCLIFEFCFSIKGVNLFLYCVYWSSSSLLFGFRRNNLARLFFVRQDYDIVNPSDRRSVDFVP